ncbi:MAG: hypothetical protein AAB803_02085 [Patescibacteria group bacterium]
MKAIIIGTSLSGKTTLVNHLRSQGNLPLFEMDDELVRTNNGSYPDDVKYKHHVLAPQIIKDILRKEEIIFFTNADYFTDEDLKTAKNIGFKVIQLEVGLDELKRRNEVRVQKEGRDDWSRWFEGMLKYQKDIKEKGLVDKVIAMNQPIEDAAKDLLTFLEA